MHYTLQSASTTIKENASILKNYCEFETYLITYLNTLDEHVTNHRYGKYAYEHYHLL
jgi:hypothetical protein